MLALAEAKIENGAFVETDEGQKMKERANAKECRFELVVIYIFKMMRDG